MPIASPKKRIQMFMITAKFPQLLLMDCLEFHEIILTVCESVVCLPVSLISVKHTQAGLAYVH